MGFLDILGFGNKSEQLLEFIAKNAVIIDVRTPAEFDGGNIKGSKNIPLDIFTANVGEIKKLNRPVITCCRFGMRSNQAVSILKKYGIDSINGGGWESLQSKL